MRIEASHQRTLAHLQRIHTKSRTAVIQAVQLLRVAANVRFREAALQRRSF